MVSVNTHNSLNYYDLCKNTVIGPVYGQSQASSTFVVSKDLSPIKISERFFIKNFKKNFIAGKAGKNFENWKSVTKESFVLNQILGVHINVDPDCLVSSEPRPLSVPPREKILINNEIIRFSKLKIIEETCDEPGQFISPIFPRMKKNGDVRIILNLKDFNKQFETIHFKMSSIKDAIDLMSRNCVFYKIDLCDAFYTFGVRKKDRKFFKFRWDGTLFQFTCLPMGFCESPRIYSRLMRTPVSIFRKKGFSIVDYLDDFLGIERKPDFSRKGCEELVHLLDFLGYTINLDKSVLDPTKIIEFLGFILNSEDMTVKVSEEKCADILMKCRAILQADFCPIRKLASLVGSFVACEIAIPMARVFYRHLEILKNDALSYNNGDFDALMRIDEEAKSDIVWWMDNISSAHFFIEDGPHAWPIHVVIESDASKTGWGGILRVPSFSKTGGLFSESEAALHINVLELMAVLFTLKAFCMNFSFTHIRLMIDNTTAVIGINKKGSCKANLHRVIKAIWIWALERNIWLSAVHIPGVENVDADFESRNASTSAEWCLDQHFFDLIMSKFGPCDVDLFASRLNHRLKKYVSRFPDPGACAVDAFYFNWSDDKLYIFPPFRLLGKVMKKMLREEVEAVLVLPMFMAWRLSSLLFQLLVEKPILLPHQAIFLHQQIGKVHPMGDKLQLLACAMSSLPGKNEAFLSKLEKFSAKAGNLVLEHSTSLILRNGNYTVVIEELIP